VRRLLLPIIVFGIVAVLGLSARAASPRPVTTLPVTIVEFAFQPPIRTIAPGDTVTWTNTGTQPRVSSSASQA
jgi:plastocyanin